MSQRSLAAGFLAAFLGFSLLQPPALADPGDPGVTANSIKFGQAAALEGPASALGLDMRAGLLAAFTEANKGGGVHGRKLELVSVNDSYDPHKSIQATRSLIEKEKVFALVGPVGTPTINATLPIAMEAGVPVIAPFTGAEFLRTPFKPNVINVRASYFQETEMMVRHLVEDAGVKRIAILYQDDAFGRTGLEGVKQALEKRGMTLAAEANFERNTTAIKGALLTLRKADPQAVILIGPYKPCAEFIKLAKQANMSPLFVNISFVGTNALAKELGPDGAGVIITQVVPFPEDPSMPLVNRYRLALQETDPGARPGFVSLEGYIAGRLIAAGLEKLQGEPTRKGFLNAVLSGPIELDGLKLRYGPNDNSGGEEVFLTVIQADGSIKAVKSLAPASN